MFYTFFIVHKCVNFCQDKTSCAATTVRRIYGMWQTFRVDAVFSPHRIKTGAFVCGVSNNRYICITIYEVVSQMGSNWSGQQENRRERREKDKISREVLGKFFYDLAKLVFTAMALVGGVALIIGGFQVVQAVLLLLGLGLTYVLAYIGYKILNA